MPALIHKVHQVVLSLYGVAVALGEDACCATHAEFALTGAHSHASAAAQVEHIVHIKVFDGIFHFAHGHLLTFAHQGVVVDIGVRHILAECAVAAFGGAECHLFAHAVGLFGASLAGLEFRAVEWSGGSGTLLVHTEFAASHIDRS